MTSIFGPLIRGGFNKLVKGTIIQCIVKIILLFADIRFSHQYDSATESTRTKRNGYQQLPEDDIKQLEQRLGDNADVIPVTVMTVQC